MLMPMCVVEVTVKTNTAIACPAKCSFSPADLSVATGDAMFKPIRYEDFSFIISDTLKLNGVLAN